jgi:hypothetical protein
MRLAEGHAMTDTAMVPRKNCDGPAGPASLIDEQLADQLLGKAQAGGVELLGPGGLLSQVHQGRAGAGAGRGDDRALGL